MQWTRASYPANAALQARVGQLIQLRTANAGLQRNEIQFFYFHPTFDQDGGTWVFAYARTSGAAPGNAGQVIVIANMCGETFANFALPGWPWRAKAVQEVGFGAGDFGL